MCVFGVGTPQILRDPLQGSNLRLHANGLSLDCRPFLILPLWAFLLQVAATTRDGHPEVGPDHITLLAAQGLEGPSCGETGGPVLSERRVTPLPMGNFSLLSGLRWHRLQNSRTLR